MKRNLLLVVLSLFALLTMAQGKGKNYGSSVKCMDEIT